jgi:DNA-directed RNA polymerase subunit RPC12/RpoP
MKMDISRDGKQGPATEYFCFRCRQLRLSLITDKTTCKNCGNRDLVVGPCGSLDKAALIRKMDGLKE